MAHGALCRQAADVFDELLEECRAEAALREAELLGDAIAIAEGHERLAKVGERHLGASQRPKRPR